MANEFTTGPWKKSAGTSVRIEAADGGCVVYCDISNRTMDECIANSYIIAAAPELLEALMGLRRLLWSEGYADQDMDMAKADAAIRKAEGV